MTGAWARFDIDLERLTLPELRDFVAWSWGEEERATEARVRSYHAAKQAQAMRLLMLRVPARTARAVPLPWTERRPEHVKDDV